MTAPFFLDIGYEYDKNNSIGGDLYQFTKLEAEMKKMVKFFLVIGLLFVLSSCAKVTLTKEITEYKYEGDKVIETYREAITQTPEKTFPIHLKHQELYE
ncbi:MAG: hypothetical protein SWC96_03630 [Thermodesulfobacteriota bacterium]|nr:hypothetical protein [Thermodesulfobacteriota bacterium]